MRNTNEYILKNLDYMKKIYKLAFEDMPNILTEKTADASRMFDTDTQSLLRAYSLIKGQIQKFEKRGEREPELKGNCLVLCSRLKLVNSYLLNVLQNDLGFEISKIKDLEIN